MMNRRNLIAAAAAAILPVGAHAFVAPSPKEPEMPDWWKKLEGQSKHEQINTLFEKMMELAQETAPEGVTINAVVWGTMAPKGGLAIWGDDGGVGKDRRMSQLHPADGAGWRTNSIRQIEERNAAA